MGSSLGRKVKCESSLRRLGILDGPRLYFPSELLCQGSKTISTLFSGSKQVLCSGSRTDPRLEPVSVVINGKTPFRFSDSGVES